MIRTIPKSDSSPKRNSGIFPPTTPNENHWSPSTCTEALVALLVWIGLKLGGGGLPCTFYRNQGFKSPISQIITTNLGDTIFFSDWRSLLELLPRKQAPTEVGEWFPNVVQLETNKDTGNMCLILSGWFAVLKGTIQNLDRLQRKKQKGHRWVSRRRVTIWSNPPSPHATRRRPRFVLKTWGSSTRTGRQHGPKLWLPIAAI